MSLDEILKLLKNKYPYPYGLILFEDGSGRITDCMDFPYKYTPEFEFNTLDNLISHLQGELKP